MEPLVDTPQAVLEKVTPDLIEIRFKHHVKIGLRDIQEVQTARQRMCAGQPHRLLTIMPPETDFDMANTTTDHYERTGAVDQIRAIALVAHGTVMEMMAKLYYSYYPQSFPIKVCSDEAEARAWLQAQARPPVPK
jgi:hypothetical protein